MSNAASNDQQRNPSAQMHVYVPKEWDIEPATLFRVENGLNNRKRRWRIIELIPHDEG